MSEDWDAAWSQPAPQPQQYQERHQKDWNSGSGSVTFTNSNRGRGRGRGGRGRTNNQRAEEGGGGWGADTKVASWSGETSRQPDSGWQSWEPEESRENKPRRQNTSSDGWNDFSTNNSWGEQKSFGDGGGRGGRGRGRGRGGSQNNQRQYDDKCEVLMIPTRKVGKVIGKGGSQIEELQTRSSARIKVSRDNDGDETAINIYGDDSTISRAKELINDLIEDRPRERQREQQPRDSEYNEPAPEEPKKPYNWFACLAECDAKVAADWAKLPPIIKNFYEEHPEVTALTEEQVAQFREENNNIVVDRTFQKEDSKPIPKPVLRFEHAFQNYPGILDEIYKAGFERPSPIQCQAWPVLLSGEDLIGIAQTGTGKTLAFLLPALIHIDGQTVPREERGGPAVLIMAPTRELALQIDKEVKKYEYKGITSCCVYGGGDRKSQINVVASGVDIVIATPGRMNDLEEAGHLNVRSVTYVVLDEADRMLDMGFEPQIRKVMYSLRPSKQCIMTSATWPPGVRRLADSYMTDPVQVYVGSLDLAATHTVSQVIQLMDEKEKEACFMDFARNLGPDEKIIVFCGTKAKADYLSVECALANIMCASLHGNRDQSDREQAVEDIKSGYVKILIATDVASRGLDIDDVTHVLNYDFPRNIEEYVHRVGRTGRAGKSGESISYFTKNDWGQAAELIKILEEAQQFVPEEVVQMAERFEAMKERRERTGETNRRGGSRFGGRGGGGGGRRY
ncbi:unnamed protein product [Ceutorhynchus assimilis]|uniref:RNA helicase n=1 Tax=Ceutorhynchus assimilis TaxID=467358 RepID=A0A9N9MLL0_9CUCU|nr:unnamed protein product [Ceutorhynchus assimilis]